MSDNAIVFQVVGVVLVLFFGFITYMNTKTWRWLHVTILFFVFAMVPTFWVYAAMVMKTRAAWMTLHDKLDAAVKENAARVKLLQRGEENDIKNEKDSVYAVKEQLTRMIMDRGRVWRGCVPGQVAGGAITLTMQIAAPPPPPPMAPMPMPADPAAPMPADPAAQPMPMPMPMPEPPAAPVSGHNIVEKMVVYAFQEAEDAQRGFKVPNFYLGEFLVTAVTPTTVSLAPTLQLSPEQLSQVNNGQQTWMLFETCPIDTYEIFAGLNAAAMSQLIPQADTGLDQQAYADLINTYVMDGQTAPENTPPDNLWVEVEFTKVHKEEVDANMANDAPDQIPFDNTGLAQPGRLRRRESDISEFKPGDIAVLPKEKADELVAADVAKIIKNVYRRSLIEFSARLRTIQRRRLEIDLLTVEIRRDIATLDATTAKANEQIELETEHKRMLDEDLAKVTYERDSVAKYGSALFAELTKTNNDIRNFYASNRALNLELRQLTAKLTEEADKRTREATAGK
ncbi:hypothetical protein [Anatilimnocola floriformis]|uniref:hypothetical protein n=1 Tax=Anatilimnocola floriformis TaxID=2948575 RepID=UPI0020C4E99D|nr:hypothetical protein [Anatilimnocola floriformis]